MTNGTVVDTSVWINYLSVTDLKIVKITNSLIDSEYLFMLPVIMQEVLQGIEDDKLFNIIRNDFLAFKGINFDNDVAALEAAMLYRALRKKGVTVRKPNDCLIAWLCIEYNLSLYHNDKDFTNIAKHTSLKIYK